MKVVAISFSEQSEEFLNSLRSLEFLDKLYIASSSQNNNVVNQSINRVNVKEFIQQNWRKIDLFLFTLNLKVFSSHVTGLIHIYLKYKKIFKITTVLTK